MNKLFEIEPIEPIHEFSPMKGVKTRCRACAYRYKHQYSDTYYCKNQLDSKTAYGNKKIKSNNFSCKHFKQK